MRCRSRKPSVGGLTLVVFTLLAAPGVSRAADEQKQLDQLTRELQQKGEAALPEDFSSKPVPAAADAVPELLQAAKLIDSNSQAWQDWDAIDDVHYPPGERETKASAAIVAESGPALALLDAALVKKEANWNVKVTSPVVRVLLPKLSEMRKAANLLRVASYDAYARGDHRAAMGRVRQLLALSRLVEREPFLVSHLVASGIGAIAYDWIFEMSPGLRIESAGKPDATAASTKQLRDILDELVDDSVTREAEIAALRSERMGAIDSASAIMSGKVTFEELVQLSPGKDQAIPIPADVNAVVTGDAKLVVGNLGLVIDAAKSTMNYPTFKKASPPDLRQALENEIEKHPYAWRITPAVDRAMRTQYRTLTERRMAATVLAVRWATIDANGKLPGRLADLTPKYLAAVPEDPMGLDRPLGYKGDGDAPMVYSVGDDGIDNGGSEKPTSEKNPRMRWGMEDVVVRLTRP